MQWPNVIDAIANCTFSDNNVRRWRGHDETCWNQLDCALTAADTTQQAEYSSAGTTLGIVKQSQGAHSQIKLAISSYQQSSQWWLHQPKISLSFTVTPLSPSPSSLCNLSIIPSGLTFPPHPKRVVGWISYVGWTYCFYV